MVEKSRFHDTLPFLLVFTHSWWNRYGTIKKATHNNLLPYPDLDNSYPPSILNTDIDIT